MANSIDLDQTALIGVVCSGSTLFASILNSSVTLGNNLQQTTSADDIFRCIFFGALRVNQGAQWLSGRVLDSRPKGRGFEPHRRHCVVALEKELFILA